MGTHGLAQKRKYLSKPKDYTAVIKKTGGNFGLRVKDIDFSQNQVVVRSGKGNKDRYTTLPTAVKEPLLRHLQRVKGQHQEDLSRGLGAVALPNALERKYPNASREWGW